MKSPQIWIDYIKNVADNYPPKGSVTFTVDDLENLLDGVFRTAVNKTGYNIQMVEPMFDNFSNEANGTFAEMLTGFSCLKYLPKLTASTVHDTQNDCYRVVRQFIARMVRDSRKGVAPLNYALNQLDEINMKKDKLAFNKGDAFFVGYLVTFKVKIEYLDNINTEVQQTGWLDL